MIAVQVVRTVHLVPLSREIDSWQALTMAGIERTDRKSSRYWRGPEMWGVPSRLAGEPLLPGARVTAPHLDPGGSAPTTGDPPACCPTLMEGDGQHALMRLSGSAGAPTRS